MLRITRTCEHLSQAQAKQLAVKKCVTSRCSYSADVMMDAIFAEFVWRTAFTAVESIFHIQRIAIY